MPADLAILAATLAVLGFGGAFLSGLVGVGGAIVMIPLLMYVPPLLGMAPLGIKTVAGITMVQVFAAAVVGVVGHRTRIDRPLFLALAPVMVVASFTGAYASGAAEPIVLQVTFAILATVAATLVLALRHRVTAETGAAVEFNVPVAVVAAALVGFAAGLIGAGGAFFLIPVLLYVLRIPVRITVGTSLAVVAMSAAAGLLGKAAASQIDWLLAAALVVGALPGARIGALVSRRTGTERLVVVLGVAIALVAVRVWVDIAGQLS